MVDNNLINKEVLSIKLPIYYTEGLRLDRLCLASIRKIPSRSSASESLIRRMRVTLHVVEEMGQIHKTPLLSCRLSWVRQASITKVIVLAHETSFEKLERAERPKL